MYDDHLRLIGKHIVDFLLALIELFSIGVTAEVYERISKKSTMCSPIQTSVLLIDVTDKCIFLWMKDTEICLYVTVNSVTLTKKTSRRGHCVTQICHSEPQHICIYINICCENTV